ILFNNAGVASSGGETPATVPEMAEHCVAFCRALGLGAINIVGFSLGGMIAQQLALDHPRLVKRIILLGTGPRGGEGMTFTELSPEEQADPVAFLLGGFFSPSKASQAAGREYMKRLESRKENRDLHVSRDSAVAQLAAIREWGTVPSTGRYATLKEISHPTLIVHGNKDIVVAPPSTMPPSCGRLGPVLPVVAFGIARTSSMGWRRRRRPSSACSRAATSASSSFE
ncbi:MAG: alpha/beta fold hydrolase, partial [Terriglobales bacterium]